MIKIKKDIQDIKQAIKEYNRKDLEKMHLHKVLEIQKENEIVTNGEMKIPFTETCNMIYTLTKDEIMSKNWYREEEKTKITIRGEEFQLTREEKEKILEQIENKS